jgi:hypothetical protein
MLIRPAPGEWLLWQSRVVRQQKFVELQKELHLAQHRDTALPGSRHSVTRKKRQSEASPQWIELATEGVGVIEALRA